jgi:hypothetical protein
LVKMGLTLVIKVGLTNMTWRITNRPGDSERAERIGGLERRGTKGYKGPPPPGLPSQQQGWQDQWNASHTATCEIFGKVLKCCGCGQAETAVAKPR